ncbi:MAG TPA: hypothetical protein VG755_32085 [Nannocystaceae bacterium]|nr:hypothetical protein [Nannocystaceae bacterium]
MGAVIVVGRQQTDVFNADTLVRKYDADGGELWTDIVPAPNPDDANNQAANDVAVTSTDEIVVVGAWDEAGIGGTTIGWIQKYAP